MQPTISHDLQRYLNQHWRTTSTFVAREVRCAPDGDVWFRCRARIKNRKTGVVTCVAMVIMESEPGSFTLFGNAHRTSCGTGPL